MIYKGLSSASVYQGCLVTNVFIPRHGLKITHRQPHFSAHLWERLDDSDNKPILQRLKRKLYIRLYMASRLATLNRDPYERLLDKILPPELCQSNILANSIKFSIEGPWTMLKGIFWTLAGTRDLVKQTEDRPWGIFNYEVGKPFDWKNYWLKRFGLRKK